MRGMLGESWDGGGDGGVSSRAAGDMIREAARCETLHLGPVQRTTLVDSDLPLPIVGGLAIADDGWDPSSDMPGAQQGLACDAETTWQAAWLDIKGASQLHKSVTSCVPRRPARAPLPDHYSPGILPPAAVVG